MNYINGIKLITNKLNNEPLIKNGFISKLYAPKDNKNIKFDERVFYTTRNADYIYSTTIY